MRGWFDRAILANNAGYAWIYPALKTSVNNSDDDYNDDWQHSITITADGVASEATLEIERPRGIFGRHWKVRPSNDGSNGHGMGHDPYTGKMPAAARWGKSHIESKVPILSVTATRARVLSDYDLGPAWVCCARGCCSTDFNW